MRSAIAAVPSIGRAVHVERAARDADATQELYERYSGQILGFCVNRLGSRDDAEDALQSTFLNAHRALQRGVEPEAELAWLYKIAHNVCLTRGRSASRRRRVESPSDFATVQDVVPAPSRESPDDLIRLTAALEHMPDSQRRAILLREWQGLSYHEIADELELSQSAVETLIFRARRTLASNLESEPKQSSRLSRMRKALDVGTLVAALKGLFEGGAAVKVAAVAVAASGTLVVATDQPTTLSKPTPANQALTSVAQTAAAPVSERTGSYPSVAHGGEAKLAARSALSSESAPGARAAAAPVALVAPQPEKQKEPKAIPPSRGKKHDPAARANGKAGKAKKKAKSKGKGATVDPVPAPVQTAPTPAPVQTHDAASSGQDAQPEKDKGPKK